MLMIFKKTKILLFLSVVCITIFSLCGCYKSNSQENQSQSTTEEKKDPSESPLAALEYYNPTSLRNRDEMIDILQREEYGYLPPKPENLYFEVLEQNIHPEICEGKAIINKLQASGLLYGRNFSFVFYETMPLDDNTHPFFIHINFRDSIPDKYMPTEYLVNQGFAVLSFCYLDVTSDNNDFTNGLAGVIYPNGERNNDGPGKIALWAWAAQRVMDYAQSISNKLGQLNE